MSDFLTQVMGGDDAESDALVAWADTALKFGCPAASAYLRLNAHWAKCGEAMQTAIFYALGFGDTPGDRFPAPAIVQADYDTVVGFLRSWEMV